MLARTAVATTSFARRTSAATATRSISNTTAVTKSFQHTATAASAAAPSALPAAATSTPPPLAPGISSGELAWCEIYGIDYEQHMQDALDESPLAVNEAHRVAHTTPVGVTAPPATTATKRNNTAKPTGDIWNVVFGASTSA